MIFSSRRYFDRFLAQAQGPIALSLEKRERETGEIIEAYSN
jgi:hypothetical protein